MPQTLPPPSSRLPIRVLHVVNGEHFSGAERVQSHLGRCLPEYGTTADFACVRPGKFAARLDDQNRRGQRWGIGHRVAMRSKVDFTAIGRLARLVRRGRYDLLHAHTPRTALLTAPVAAWTGRPWVYHVHSPATRDSSRIGLNRLNGWIERWCLRGASAVVTVSGSLKNDCIAHGVSAGKIHVVPNGVPVSDRPPHRPPTPGGPLVLGMVALHRPRKGLEVAIEAIDGLGAADAMPEVLLRIIGPFETPAYRREILELIERRGVGSQIQWVGFTDDVAGELEKIDALVLPSLYGEGMPMVVLEAMAAGVPVLATEVEGTPEAITDGVEGFLTRPGDARGLREIIERLAGGLVDWSAMSAAAVTRHADRLSDHAMAAATAAIYQPLLGQPAPLGPPPPARGGVASRRGELIGAITDGVPAGQATTVGQATTAGTPTPSEASAAVQPPGGMSPPPARPAGAGGSIRRPTPPRPARSFACYWSRTTRSMPGSSSDCCAGLIRSTARSPISGSRSAARSPTPSRQSARGPTTSSCRTSTCPTVWLDDRRDAAGRLRPHPGGRADGAGRGDGGRRSDAKRRVGLFLQRQLTAAALARTIRYAIERQRVIERLRTVHRQKLDAMAAQREAEAAPRWPMICASPRKPPSRPTGPRASSWPT